MTTIDDDEKNAAAIASIAAVQKFSNLSSPPLNQGERNLYRWGFKKGAKWMAARNKELLDVIVAVHDTLDGCDCQDHEVGSTPPPNCAYCILDQTIRYHPTFEQFRKGAKNV
jgi:hypothetical protein